MRGEDEEALVSLLPEFKSNVPQYEPQKTSSWPRIVLVQVLIGALITSCVWEGAGAIVHTRNSKTPAEPTELVCGSTPDEARALGCKLKL